ncbi:MAG: hypothetical protein JSV09_04660 [Thermoplasmata archaeon]|nr:MAG: hypothetical protein JSV09_04660 [Thermoplasmata archaeon]
MEGFEVLVAIVTVIAALLLFISALAYKSERSRGLLFTTVIFTLFLTKGVALTISIFTSTLEDASNMLILSLLFDVIVLLFLFFAMLSAPKDRERVKIESKKTKEKKT